MSDQLLKCELLISDYVTMMTGVWPPLPDYWPVTVAAIGFALGLLCGVTTTLHVQRLWQRPRPLRGPLTSDPSSRLGRPTRQ